ncbi:hypothetical protein [Silanimonas sp.]|uniref:hypothetical protein n=1 Tax=Silanimonas sp. TaxID=1929290 RepID=UPI001BB9B392|nr:hypothetical protein [Silanimonas sp.]MBS3896721.1 hypothetical protein [Silanimonas sp.]MBS3924613.1 hypothetical protein [Xanthomonadaceae bacterium]MBS3925007.1 hypothetical protein [Xanthomonadaceae bacterium]
MKRFLKGFLFLSTLLFLAQAKAEPLVLPMYEAKLLPGHVVNHQEMILQIQNNFDNEVDTLYVNFVDRRWLRVGNDGVVSGAWTPDQDVHFNAATPESVKNILCLAGLPAFAGCMILIPVAWSVCQAGATAAARRADNWCRRSGRVLQINNSGVCGQGKQTSCVVLRETFHFITP